MFLAGLERLNVECKRDLDLNYVMKYLRLMHYFLGLEVWKIYGYTFLGQGKYVVDILKRFNMLDCTLMYTPMVIN
jgi:hypothetical protein